MAGPVKFTDLGKDTKDLLGKNFHFGVVKVEAKTKSLSGVDFTLDGCHNLASGNVASGLEFKAKVWDMDWTEKWTTDNKINMTLSSSNKLIAGLKTDLDAVYSPKDGDMAAKLKTVYTKDKVLVTVDSNFSLAPTVTGSAVVAHEGWLAGGQASYDVGSKALTGSSLAFGYNGDGYKIHSAIVDFSKYTGSIFHAVSDKLQAGVQVGWTTSGGDPTLAVAAKYAPSADAYYKTKIDNNLQVGVSYCSKLNAGAQVTLSGLVNGKALNGGGHQLGLALDLSA